MNLWHTWEFHEAISSPWAWTHYGAAFLLAVSISPSWRKGPSTPLLSNPQINLNFCCPLTQNLREKKRYGSFFSRTHAVCSFSVHVCYIASVLSELLRAHPMDWSLSGSSVHGILQARILEWVAIPSSRGSSWPMIEPMPLMSPTLAGRFFTISATWEACSFSTSLNFVPHLDLQILFTHVYLWKKTKQCLLFMS